MVAASIPDNALNTALAVIGRTGSGKTYTAKGAVEGLLSQSRRVCIIDPTGAWWGLRLASDGSHESGHAVVIFGGDHADGPINADAAEKFGALIAGGSVPQALVDVSEFSNNEITRFLTAFFEEVYRLNRGPLHLILDEADMMAPQSPMPEQRRLQGAINKIVRRGRIKGFRPMLITQRPQVIDKSVLSQIDTLIALQLTSAQDRKAILEWVKGHAGESAAQSVVDSLASLPRGTGYIWSPEHDLLDRVVFPPITTFDSSCAPETGSQVFDPMPLAQIDLAAITAALDVEQSDVIAKGKPGIVEKAQIAEAYDRALQEGLRIGEHRERERIQLLIASPVLADCPHPTTASPPRSPRPNSSSSPPTKPRASTELHPAGEKLLEALARHHPARWTWGQVGLLAGLKASGGHFNAGRKSLRDAGYIDEAGELVYATDLGLNASGVIPSAPSTPQERLDMWCSKLPAPAPDMLRALSSSGAWMSTDQLADRFGKKPTGGHWNTGVAVLRKNGLIEVSGRNMRLASIFTREAA